MNENNILWVKICITPDQPYKVKDIEKYRQELAAKVSKAICVDCKIEVTFAKGK